MENAKQLANVLNKTTVKIDVKSGENGKIFGAVTSTQIVDCLKKQHNIEIDKKKIVVSEPIKATGRFFVEVRLYEGVIAKMALNII